MKQNIPLERFTERGWTLTEWNCPHCENPLCSIAKGDGFVVWCAMDLAVCSVRDISGNGKTEKSAYEILIQKLSKGKD